MAIAKTIPIYFSTFWNQPLNLARHVAMQNEDYFSQIPMSLHLDMAMRPSSDHWNVSKCIEYQPRKFLKGGSTSTFALLSCHLSCRTMWEQQQPSWTWSKGHVPKIRTMYGASVPNILEYDARSALPTSETHFWETEESFQVVEDTVIFPLHAAKPYPNLSNYWPDVITDRGWEDTLEEGMATHSSILAWRIPMDRGAWWATVHVV